MFQGEPNEHTYEAMCKAYKHLLLHDNIMVSVSGGSDSDLVIDILLRVAERYNIDKAKLHFVFFDTGIEMKATKEHLDYLEQHYGIVIERHRAKLPVAAGVRKYGLPFISKEVALRIERLQRHDFDFAQDGAKPYEELLKKYQDCGSSLRWWCSKKKEGFGIEAQPYLKEFMIQYPPDFRISAKCCDGAKKNTSKDYEKIAKPDLKCLGVRKLEGGLRASAYKSCFDDDKPLHNYRPIYWFSDKDKTEYRRHYKLVHSEAYTKYRFTRTGCAGCPFSGYFESNLQVLAKFEPALYKAVSVIFAKSYEYTRAYRAFAKARGACKRSEGKPKNSLI